MLLSIVLNYPLYPIGCPSSIPAPTEHPIVYVLSANHWISVLNSLSAPVHATLISLIFDRWHFITTFNLP